MVGTALHISGVLLLLLPLFGCAQSVGTSSVVGNQISIAGSGNGTAATAKGAAQLLTAGEAGALPHPQEGSPPGNLPFVRNRPKLVPPFPLVLNRAVQNYINSYVAQPEGLRQSFQRSGPYMPEMTALLESNGLPRDLIYLAFAESAFTDSGAGPWQLSKTTARRYGLIINNWIDERRDPIRSTQAAAEYLAELHDQTGANWRMTLVAWNNGNGGVARYLRLMDAPYRRLMRRLPRRTQSLLNRFMAVALIARHAKEFGLDAVSYSDTPRYRVIAVDGGTPLQYVAESHRTSLSLLRNLNPALLHDRTPPGPQSYPIRIPDNSAAAHLESTDS
jgi:membrane-bound lytic murein transglycosylase D